MKTFKFLITTILSIFFSIVFGQDIQKNYTAVRTNEAPKIDGLPFEKVWDKSELDGDFIMRQPDNGLEESKNRTSSIKILYDDKLIYVAAFLFSDPHLMIYFMVH